MNEGQIIGGFMKRQQTERLEKLAVLNQYARKGQILFTGSSLMEQFPIEELLMSRQMHMTVYNRGVGGFTTTDMLAHMEEMVFGVEPSKIFMNIGTNDIGAMDYEEARLLKNYREILRQIRERLPEAVIYIMAYYPVNEVDKVPEGEWGKYMFINRTNANIHAVNQKLSGLAEELGCRFIDVNQGLTDECGRLKKEFTVEGIHMYANAYQVILENLKPYL